MEEAHRRLVIVGDPTSGKTSLLMRFCPDAVPEVQCPSVLGRCSAALQVDGKQVNLELCDTFGSEEYDRIRPLSYPNTQVALITFSIGAPGSLQSVKEKWAPEVLRFFRRRSVILVGCKKDLRLDSPTIEKLEKSKEKPVSYEEGEKLAGKLGIYGYLECSAKTDEGISEALELATRATLQSQTIFCKAGGHKCCIL